jgi:hypothetical protein
MKRKPGERYMFADFMSPSRLWEAIQTYPLAYADGSSYAALRATDLSNKRNFKTRQRVTCAANG